MKKLLSIIVAIMLLLCACDNKGKLPDAHVTSDDPASTTTDDGIVWEPKSDTVTSSDYESGRFVTNGNGQFNVITEDEIKIDTSKLNIAGNMNVFNAEAYSKSKEICGLDAHFSQFWSNEIAIKVMAGDPDVDIYLLDVSTYVNLKEKNIVWTIESEKVSEFVDGCFNYLSDIAYNDNGKVIAMPVYSHASGFIAYPRDAANELGFTTDDIKYDDGYYELISTNSGSRKSYSMGMGIFSILERQYESYYCDFKNKEFDYNTEQYRSLYERLNGWHRNGPLPVMTGFSHPSELGADSTRLKFDAENTLFIEMCNYSDLMFAATADPFANIEAIDLNEWCVVPIPRISEKVDANYVNPTYAIINPFSKHKDEALKFLEYIASDYFSAQRSYSFIVEDKSVYPERYMTDSHIFSDVHSIYENGFLQTHFLSSTRNDIDEYQNGRITLDEAIAMYQREVEIWLNE